MLGSGPARRQVNAKELERGSNSQQGFLNHLTDNLSSANHRSYSHPELGGDLLPAATLSAESGNLGAIHGFPGPPQSLPFGLGQEMQHYERRGLLILRAKCLRDGGRLQEKRNRTGILMHELFCSATV